MTRARLDVPAIFALALAARFGLVFASTGGPAGNFGYDAGVYYAAADALVHGRLPYADFVLLHPPGMMLALTPFAVLGQLTSDHTGFMIANAAFAVLGAGNAVLVLAVARRLGCSRGAALLGAAFYAGWLGTVGAEVSARLEPLSGCAFLTALLLLAGREQPSRRRSVVAGAALGVAACVKIWWVVPLVLVLPAQAYRRRSRAGLVPLAGGALASIAVLNGPFFVAAPSAMWHMVVLDQLGRGYTRSPLSRLVDLSSVRAAFPGLHGAAEVAVVLAAVAMLGVAAHAAWRLRPARPIVVVAGVQLAVLLTAPSYFGFYADYAAAALALVVAAGAQATPRAMVTVRARTGSAAATGLVVAVSCITAIALVVRPVRSITRFPGAPLARAVAQVRCVMADSPMALIELDSLSRDLRNGCPNWVDVTGRTYGTDAPTGADSRRADNRRWQADVLRYLLSGNAVIVIRAGTGLSPASRAVLRRHPVLQRAGNYLIYRTR